MPCPNKLPTSTTYQSTLRIPSHTPNPHRPDLTEDWYGWRQRGRYLVSDEGQRITVERLRGLLWREQMDLRRQGFASRRKAEQRRRSAAFPVKVVVVDLAAS